MKKITLSMEESVIEEAKRIARDEGTSVSALFSRWVGTLARREQEEAEIPANSITARARGIVRLPKGQSESDILTNALMEKHGTSGS